MSVAKIEQIPLVKLTELNSNSYTIWDFASKSEIQQLVSQDLANTYRLSDTSSSDLNEHSGNSLIIRSYPQRLEYTSCFEAMLEFTAQRDADTVDQILLLEHEPVFTQGIAGKAEHVLALDKNIPLVQTDRGGQVTYHGPKQQIIYLLLDFNRKKKIFAEHEQGFQARDIVTTMEEAVTNVLTHLGLKDVHPLANAPGIYVDKKKVSSLGLKVSRLGTYHGIAINLAMDLKPFLLINPCGYQGLEMCNVSDYLSLADLLKHERFKDYFKQSLSKYSEAANNSEEELVYLLIKDLIAQYFITYLAMKLGYHNIYTHN